MVDHESSMTNLLIYLQLTPGKIENNNNNDDDDDNDNNNSK